MSSSSSPPLAANTMRAMVLTDIGKPLEMTAMTVPRVEEKGDVLIRVLSCGICRTDLHVIDGELYEPAKVPIVPGHQIVGEVVAMHPTVERLKVGDRVGVPWLGKTCGECEFCLSEQENLCDKPRFTGYQQNGGFAEYCIADERFCLNVPDGYDDILAAPLLCAGVIGFRSYRMIPKGANFRRIGLFGFGSAASIMIKVARFHNQEVYVFTRPGHPPDSEHHKFPRSLGATWVGGSDQSPPEPLDAAVIFAPAGPLVVAALKAVRKGGHVICAGIHMSDIPSFPYKYLWGERVLRSVANLTRDDGVEFLKLVAKIDNLTTVTKYSLADTNRALDDLRHSRFEGSAVIVVPRESGASS